MKVNYFKIWLRRREKSSLWGGYGLNPGPDTGWNVGYYIADIKGWKLPGKLSFKLCFIVRYLVITQRHQMRTEVW
jgi:hypothetical protein